MFFQIISHAIKCDKKFLRFYKPNLCFISSAVLRSERGKESTIVRLIITAIATLLLDYSFLSELPTQSETFGDAVINVTVAIGSATMIGAFFWIFVRWVTFIAPKSLGWANGLWENWIPLLVISLVVKAMIWLYILIFPITLSSVMLMPMLWVTMFFAKLENTFSVSLGYQALGVTLLSLVAFQDICELKIRNKD